MSQFNQTSNVYVAPVVQVSPYSGMSVHPKIEQVTDNWGTTTTSAKWVDPARGQVFKQGVISVEDPKGIIYDINSPDGRRNRS